MNPVGSDGHHRGRLILGRWDPVRPEREISPGSGLLDSEIVGYGYATIGHLSSVAEGFPDSDFPLCAAH